MTNNSAEPVIDLYFKNGMLITRLTMAEFKCLLYLFDNMFPMDKAEFDECVQARDFEEIHENFLMLFNLTPDLYADYFEQTNISPDTFNNLYSKLKGVTILQAFDIVDTLLDAHKFMYMFRFGEVVEGKLDKLHTQLREVTEQNCQINTRISILTQDIGLY